MLEAAGGLTLTGFAGCVGAPGAAGQQAEGDTTTGDDHAGHGESEHGHDTVSEPKQTREVVVNTARGENTNEFHFNPHVTWVTVGGTVTWRLESGTHTATAYHQGNNQPRLVPEGTDAWDSGTLSEEGQTYEHTFDTEGVYHYLCKPHEQFGMIATVIVGEPHPDDQVALGTMPADKPEEVHQKLQELNGMVKEVLGDDHHDEGATTEDGHHEDETTETDHHHDDGATTETDHHEGTDH